MKRDDTIYLKHILESIGEIESFIDSISKKDFLNNSEKQAAVVRMLEVIGEAVKNISKEFKNKHPRIEWAKIAGARDVMIHAYFDVNLDIVWDIVKQDIPVLKNKIKPILYEIELQDKKRQKKQ